MPASAVEPLIHAVINALRAELTRALADIEQASDFTDISGHFSAASGAISAFSKMLLLMNSDAEPALAALSRLRECYTRRVEALINSSVISK